MLEQRGVGIYAMRTVTNTHLYVHKPTCRVMYTHLPAAPIRSYAQNSLGTRGDTVALSHLHALHTITVRKQFSNWYKLKADFDLMCVNTDLCHLLVTWG